MKVDKRPFAGSWSLDIQNKYRTVVSWTPDAIVQFNGNTTLPGCPTCKNRIDFSSFITSVSVGGGIDSGGASCSINLTIPKSYGDVVYVDGKFILETGIEIKVFFRGFFKSKDLSLKADSAVATLSTGEGSEEIDLNSIETRPYYPVFHGFISAVSIDNKDNSYSVSISTNNILSMWNSQMINTEQGFFAANPKEARGSISLNGHVYTNMTAHQIIYALYRDTGGSPEGTGFALQKKNNLLSKISTGQQKYSLYLRYLENRWGNGLYGLRMFGASGRAYTLLEQSILVDTTPEGKDNEFKKVVKEQLKPHAKAKKGALSNLMKAGFIAHDPQGRTLRTLDVRQLPSIIGEKEDAVNILSLKSFITDLGSLGQVNFWESQFSSKLSLAQEVAEKVGYEFYQDMDGDLVFKPPMYNMDTSEDRIYRINREDTISISYEHNEPEFTYVICSGGPFRNLKGTNLEGEWGVKGMYVDYKLVAKYGWKSFSFDTTFYNSARKAFYASVVALDNANKATEGCGITIPLRPELKPGYPVYVEENDCFYYVESVSHNFSYGGECTTQLTLSAQRKKFIPPGRTEVSYAENPSEAVDLADTSLPEKSIYTTESRENSYGEKITVKKRIGFPNVVMALDPFKMSPEAFKNAIEYQNMGYLGTETRQAYRNMLLIEGKRYGIIKTAEGASLFEGPWTFKINGREGTLGLEKENSPYLRKLKNGRVVTSRISKKQTKSKSIILGESALERAASIKRSAREKASKLLGKGKLASTNEAKAKRILDSAEKEFKKALGDLTNNGSDQIFTLYDLILELRKQTDQSQGQDDGLNLADILRQLDNKKSSFAPHLPGYYRYYSCSHPSREHQGPYIPSVTEETEGVVPDLRFDPPGIADPTRISMVVSDPLHGKDNVLLKEERGKVVAGINTRTLYTNGFEYIPTKDIKTLTFQVNQTIEQKEVEVGRKLDPTAWESSDSFGSSFRANLINVLTKTITKKYKPTSTLAQIRPFVFKQRNKIPAGYPSDFYLNGQPLSDSSKLETIPGATKNNKAKRLAAEIATKHMEKLSQDYPDLFRASEESRAKELAKLLRTSRSVFKPNVSGKFMKGRSRKEVRRRFVQGKMISPVFPVSDDKGYEVFGAYQYGRGLRPAKDTLFDAILRQDPSRMFTQLEINEIRDSLGDYDTTEAFQSYYRNKIVEKINTIYNQGEGREHVQEIYKAFGLDLDDENTDPEKGFTFDTLASRMMTRSEEQIIQNVPRSLLEIRPDQRDQAMCSCKGTTSEAVLLYSSVNLDSSLVEIENPIVAESIRASKEKLLSWQNHQKTLRGEHQAGRGISLDSVIKQTRASFEDLQTQASNIGDALDNLTDKEKYNEAYNKRNKT